MLDLFKENRLGSLNNDNDNYNKEKGRHIAIEILAMCHLHHARICHLYKKGVKIFIAWNLISIKTKKYSYI